MSEEEKNISDDMSSLIHAAEEWANELKQTEMIDSNNFDDSDSYPIHVPIEEVARQVALELCKTYNWNPEIGADNQFPKGNAGDTTASIHHQSSEVSTTLLNIPQNVVLPSIKLSRSNFAETSAIPSSTEHMEYQQQETLFASQPLATIHDDTINKTFTVTSNTSLKMTEELDIPDQVIYDNNTINKTFIVRRNTLPSMLEKLDINKTFIVRRNTLSNVPKELDTHDEVINDNSKQIPTASEKIALPITDTMYSFAKDASFSNKIFTIQNSEKSIYISSDDNFSDTLDKNRMPKLKEYSEDTSRKFLSTILETSPANPVLNTMFSSITTDHHQKLSENNHNTCTLFIKSLKETQKIPIMLTNLNRNPESKNVNCRSNFFIAHKDGNTAINSCCATVSNTNSAMKDEDIVFSPIVEKNIFTINEIIPETSINDKDMRRSIKLSEDTMNLSKNNMSTVKGVIEKEKNLPIIKLAKSNISQNNALYQKDKNAEDISQKQLIISDKDKYHQGIDMINKCFVTDHQTQVSPSYLKNNGNNNTSYNQEFQTMIENKVLSLEKNLLKYISERKFITKAIQTDQINGNKLINESDISYNNILLKKQIDTPKNVSFNTSLSINPINDIITEQAITANITFDKDELIKSSESMILTSRRKSLLTPRNISHINTPIKSIRQSISRSNIIHKSIHSTPTMISKPTTASIMKQRSKSIHSVQPINPPKKPNELPLENRASRLKAEYLAKKRANEAHVDKSRMIGIKEFASIMTSQSSLVMQRKISCTSIQRSAKSENFNFKKSNHSNINYQLGRTFGQLPSNNETPKSTKQRCGRQKKSIQKLSQI